MKTKLRKYWKRAKKVITALYLSVVILGILLFPAFAFSYRPEIHQVAVPWISAFTEEGLLRFQIFPPKEEIYWGPIETPFEAAQAASDVWRSVFHPILCSWIFDPYVVEYSPQEDLWYISDFWAFGVDGAWRESRAVLYIRGRDGKVISVYYG